MKDASRIETGRAVQRRVEGVADGEKGVKSEKLKVVPLNEIDVRLHGDVKFSEWLTSHQPVQSVKLQLDIESE